ncbi:MAG: helix-turn-helix domain-containing protein [Candidatus Izemoplasmatales bacterium]
MNRIQDNIKRIRKEHGMTQEDVASKLYVTRQLISKWEMGKSLPNIADVERLAEILGVGVDDLLDDESVKSITLSEAIDNRKKRKFVWISIFTSIVAVGLGLFVLLSALSGRDDQIEVIVAYCYVTEADVELGKYAFENDSLRVEIDVFRDSFGWNIIDADGTPYAIEELVVGDNVQISYEADPSNGLSIVVIDKVLDVELMGVFVTSAATAYASLDEITAATEGVRFCYQSENRSGWNAETEVTTTQDRFYIHATIDVYIDLDPLKIPDEARIGLIRSDGIVEIDLVDLDSQRTYTYEGAYRSGGPELTTTETVRVTYRIHVRFVSTVDSFTVLEYDQNHDLVMETSLSSDNAVAFVAQEETLQAYVVTKRTVVGGPYGTDELTNAYELLRGETRTFAFADGCGMVDFVDYTLD